jgi:hypothetical protein
VRWFAGDDDEFLAAIGSFGRRRERGEGEGEDCGEKMEGKFHALEIKAWRTRFVKAGDLDGVSF